MSPDANGSPTAPTSNDTHEVFNQSVPLVDYDLYESDRVLREHLRRETGTSFEPGVRAFGKALGRSETIQWGFQANTYTPELRTHDRFGHRIDEVEFHPAWHEIMRLAMAHETHNQPWRDPTAGSHAARIAKHYMLAQIEAGSGCPITMTFACVPALRHQPEIAAEWEPLVCGTEYDPRPIAYDRKKAVLIGMAMTEKQGGSDVRSNTTRARAIDSGGPGALYELTGHKWFCSAPMCDAFLTLGQTERGLSCFLVPRWLPDGTRNPLRIQRLKNKLGNRSNASSEIEYAATLARMVGEEGRGIATIIEMVHHTRLDCVSGSSGLMRQAVAQAIHHAEHRSAFGKRLIEQPLMRNVLADLAVEVEAATVLLLRLARSYDHAGDSEQERAFARIATAIGKYWVCKRAPHLIYEAMECLGGNGYVEDFVLARLYREAPVNSIWEGSGNVMCLDVLRAAIREPDSVPALLAEIGSVRGQSAILDGHLDELERALADSENLELRARRIVEAAAVALQAALLLQHAPGMVADAFLASRLGPGSGRVFGTLPPSVDTMAILERARPQLD